MPESVQAKRRLVSTVSVRIIAVAVLAILLVGGISLYRDYTTLQNALQRDLADFENGRRKALEDRVRQAKAYADYERSRFDEALRAELKEEVYHAHRVANHLVQRFGPTLDRDALADIVRETLRPLRWREERAYFFIVDLDGVNQLHPPDPSIEGTNVLANPSASENVAASAVVRLAKSQVEGFLEWEWPNPSANGERQTKRGFVKLFEPLDWIIGTGEYLPDFEADLKKDVLAWLDAVNYGDGAYIFVGQWDGLALSKKPDVRGRNMWDAEDVNGFKVVQELVAKSRAGGGLVEYMSPDSEDREPFRKISYVLGIPEWEWYLGTGTSLKEIEAAIATRRADGVAKISRRATYFALFLVGVLGVFVLLVKRMAVRVESDFRSFTEFFTGAATTGRPLETERLAFVEFEELAHAANRMIDKRTQIGEQLRESAELYRTAFQTNPDSINLNRLSDGVFVDINDGFTAATGFTREDVIGKPSADIRIWVNPEDRDRLVTGLREHGQVTNLEARFRRKDGSLTIALMSARVINIEGVPHILSITRNISKLKEAEEALRKSEEQYRLLVENQTDLIVKGDLEGRFLYVSPSCCELLGMSEGELLGQQFLRFIHEDDREAAVTEFKKTTEPPYVAYAEVRYHTEKGLRWLAWQSTAVLDSEGNVREIFGIGRDIHDRKIADDALIEAESKFRRAMESMPLIGVSVDAQGGIVFANDHFLGLTGWTADEIIGRNWFELFLPADQSEEVANLVRDAVARGDLGNGTHHENEIVTKAGDRLLVSWFNVLTKEPGGKVTGITGLGLDVTERTRAQKALEEERRFITTVLETLTDGVIACNAKGEINLVNRAVSEIHGFDEASALAQFNDPDVPLRICYPDGRTPVPYDELPVFQASRGERIRGAELVLLSGDGSHRTISVNAEAMHDVAGETSGAVAIIRDITDQKRTEEQLRHAQKMEAVGQLTGGIAHDFNNLLQVILANLQIAEEHNKDNSALLGWLASARRAGWRGAELTQKLLSFSRKQTLYPEAVDPDALISNIYNLLRRTLGEDIDIRTNVHADTPAIQVDPGGLESAILNLAVNARAAMRDGGRLTIDCRPRVLKTEIAIENDILPAGSYVEIAIADSGCGMAPEVLNHAFEPFFTTKDVGEGSGLGLSMVYGFVRQSGGNVNIVSEVDAGTTVTLLLPVAKPAERRDIAEAEAVDSHSGTGTVLVVEDDPDVRASTVVLFEMLGYDTFEAEDGEAALKVLDENASIGLLFSDVVMPKGMSGIDLVREAMQKYPSLKVVLCSGYPETDLRKSGLPEGEFQLLTKPYTFEELSAVLNAVMD